jgi:hypothetical protein
MIEVTLSPELTDPDGAERTPLVRFEARSRFRAKGRRTHFQAIMDTLRKTLENMDATEVHELFVELSIQHDVGVTKSDIVSIVEPVPWNWSLMH